MTLPAGPADGVGTRRHQRLLCFVLFAIGYSAQGVAPVMLLYTDELELPTTMLTVFFTVYAVGLMIAFLIGGPLSDRRGRKTIVVPSMILLLLSLVALLAGAAWGTPMILIARFVQGFASGACFTVGTVWLREMAGTRLAANAAMRASGFLAVGFALGPFLSGFLVQWLPLKLFLTVLIVIAILACAVLVARTLPETMTERRPGRIQISLPAGTGTGFLCYLVPCGLVVYSFAMLSVVAFPFQIRNAGFDLVYVVAGLSAFMVQCFAVIATIVANRVGPATAGWLAGISGTLGCLIGILAVQPGGWLWVLPACAVLGFGCGLAMTSGVTVADLLAPPDRRGALISMFYIVVYAGYSSSTVLSLIWGPQTMERTGTLVGLAVAAVVLAAILAGPGRAVVRRRTTAHSG